MTEINKNKSRLFKVLLFIIVCLLISNLLLLGYSPLRVISSSMEPEYPVNTVVIIKKERFENLKEGDVIAFKSYAVGGKLALHRITRITENGFYTKGDNNRHEDNQIITKDSYVGKSIARITFLAGYISAVKTPLGFTLFLLFPAAAAVVIYKSIGRLRRG